MISLRNLDALDADLVTQTISETTQRIQEDNPRIDVRRGVFAELLVYYHAVLDTQRQQNINDYLLGRSLKALEENPELADPDLVDDILSNYLIDRKAGAQAVGEVTIVVSDNVTVTIAQGAAFTANGLTFETSAVFTAKAEVNQIAAPTDRLLTRTADGNWAFTITVQAVDEGPEYSVAKDTLVVPVVLPPNYVTSFATSDFTGGLAAETNTDLLARLRVGIAAKAPSNRTNMEAMLRAVEAFSRVIRTSIIGFGDGEQSRGYRTIFPVTLPGRVDWYVRTQEAPLSLGLTKTATLVTKNADGTGVWQFAVGRDDAPGFYEIRNIRPVDTGEATGGFEIAADVRGFDLTGTGFKPDVATATEAAYSRYATTIVRFTDTATNHTALTVGATADYSLEAVCQPLIADIQDYMATRDVRSVGADCLVRAPVPCFVMLHFTIEQRADDVTPDTAAIKTALCRLVNNVGFVGKLVASQLQDVTYGFLSSTQTVGALDMLGRIRYPNDTISYVRDSEVLLVPDDPANSVTARTVQFFMTPGDVGITVTTSVPSD